MMRIGYLSVTKNVVTAPKLLADTEDRVIIHLIWVFVLSKGNKEHIYIYMEALASLIYFYIYFFTIYCSDFLTIQFISYKYVLFDISFLCL